MIKAQCSDLTTKLSAAQIEMQAQELKTQSPLERNNTDLQDQLSNSQQKLSDLQNKLEASRREITGLKDVIQRSNNETTHLKNKLKDSEKKQMESGEQIRQINAELSAARKNESELRVKMKGLREEKEGMKRLREEKEEIKKKLETVYVESYLTEEQWSKFYFSTII